MKMGLKTDRLKLSEIGLCLNEIGLALYVSSQSQYLEMDKGTALW
jgi:hypothetical protein